MFEPEARPKRSENLRRRRLNQGVDENGGHIRQGNRRTEFVANTPDGSRLRKKTGKDVGPNRLCGSHHSQIVSRQSRLRGEQPQSGCCIRGTPAKSRRCRQSLD